MVVSFKLTDAPPDRDSDDVFSFGNPLHSAIPPPVTPPFIPLPPQSALDSSSSAPPPTVPATSPPALTAHLFWRIFVLLHHLSITGFLLIGVLYSYTHKFDHPIERSNVMDFVDYLAVSLHPISLVCTGFLIISNPRSPSRFIELLATTALILQPLLCILLKLDLLAAVLGYITYFVGYVILSRMFFLKRAEAANLPTPVLKKFIFHTLPTAAVSYSVGILYFACEIIPCYAEFNPFSPSTALVSSDPTLRCNRCDDSTNSLYTFQLIFVAAFFLTVYVLPFHALGTESTYTFDDAIRFNVHPRHAVLIILFLVSAFFAMFIFASFREVIPLYSVYFDALTWEGKLKRSGMNVLVRMLLAFIMYGAVRPIDASAAASSYTNSYLPRFQTIRGFFQNKLRQLSHHQPTQLAPAWRHMLFYYILGAMVTALLYVWFTFCYPVEFMEGLSGNALEKGNREMHAAIVGTVASLMQPFLAVSCSAFFLSRPNKSSKFDTIFPYANLVANFAMIGGTALYRESRDLPSFFVGGFEQIVIAITLVVTFPLVNETRSYVRTFSPALTIKFVHLIFTTLGATLPLLVYLTANAIGCLASKQVISAEEQCRDYIQAQYVICSNIMFSVLFTLHTYTTEVISWEDTVTLKNDGRALHNWVLMFTRIMTSLLTAAVFGQSAGDESFRSFCTFVLIFDFVAWTVTLVVHARRVHKLIVIEGRDWEGEDGGETKGSRFSIFALLRGLRKRVQALLCKGEKKEMNKVVAAEKDGLRLASILRATLFVMALLPIFTNTLALLLELQGTPRAHNLSALVLLMEDSTFAMSTLAAVTYCTSDVRGAGFTKKQVVVIWAPCCAAAMMAFNIVVLHADRRAKGEGVVMYVGGAAVVWVLSFMTVASAAKMRASLSRKEIDRHVVYEVAVVIGTVFPPMVVLAAQHSSCLIADYNSREASGDSFDYYGNDCSAVNWVTKPLSVLIYSTGYYRVCFAGIIKKGGGTMSLQKILLVEIGLYQYFRLFTFSIAAALAIMLYGVGAERGDGDVFWIRNAFLAFVFFTGVLLLSEAGYAVLAVVQGMDGADDEEEDGGGGGEDEVEMVEMSKLAKGRRGKKKRGKRRVSVSNLLKTAAMSTKHVLKKKMTLGNVNAGSAKSFRGSEEGSEAGEGRISVSNLDLSPGYI